jgi:hypothetical protein
MADKSIRADGSDGSAIAILAHDTGNKDAQGREIYTLGVDATIEIESIEIGKVDQGAAGTTPWPVIDGTDPIGTGAGTQAGSTTVGVGNRGWLSTLVGLFQTVIGSGKTLPISGSVTANDGQKVDASGTVITGASLPAGGVGFLGWLSAIWAKLNAGLAVTGTFWQTTQPVSQAKVATSFSVVDSLTRPANATPYTAQQSINCNLVVTGVSISGTTVTLTVSGSAIAVGDYITVAGVNSGWGVTGVDGNYQTIAGTNATTIKFTAASPAGSPSGSGGTVSKMLAFDVAGVNGGGVVLSEIKVSLPGIAMTGAVRVYIYIGQVPVLVDQSTFTVLLANGNYRRDYYDIYPVTEGAGSDTCMGTWRGWEVIKCDPADTHLFVRLCSEGAGTPANAGVVTVRLAGVQLGG